MFDFPSSRPHFRMEMEARSIELALSPEEGLQPVRNRDGDAPTTSTLKSWSDTYTPIYTNPYLYLIELDKCQIIAACRATKSTNNLRFDEAFAFFSISSTIRFQCLLLTIAKFGNCKLAEFEETRVWSLDSVRLKFISIKQMLECFYDGININTI